jgi:hypothetical protein
MGVTPALVWNNDRTPHQVALSASSDPGADEPTPVTPIPPDQNFAHIYLPAVQAGAPSHNRRLEGPSGLEWHIFLPLLGR